MRADIKARWVEALRSGQYHQAKGHLRTEEGYCCLGVLCDISGIGRWGPSEQQHTTLITVYPYLTESTRDICDLDYPIRDGIGLDHDHMCSLIDMNDEGRDFGEIADYIDENL